MAGLLSLLVLLVSAAIVSLLAWAGTRSRLPLLAFVAFLVASAFVTSRVVAEDDRLRFGDVEHAQAEEAAQSGTSVDAASSPDAAALDTVTEAAPVARFPLTEPTSQFIGEPVTDEGGFSLPTAFAIGQEGELYVGDDFGIAIVRDTTGDGYYDNRRHFGLDGGWVFGLDFYDGALYAAVAGSTLRLRDLDGDDMADEIVTLTDGLPHNQYGGHSNSGLAVGPDGLLYMGIGGTSDHGPELEPLGGTISTMGLAGGDPQVYASGLRNPYDLAFCPDGRLYAVDNGPDQLDETLTFRPWDEVNLIVAGGNYGYPDYFGPVTPETGTISPAARLGPSAGITGITCYTGASFPATYHGDLFVTLWGTFTYPVETGRRVIWVHLQEMDDGPRATPVEFMDGFGHPIDILEDTAGNLLVLDYELGQVIRIRYVGA